MKHQSCGVKVKTPGDYCWRHAGQCSPPSSPISIEPSHSQVLPVKKKPKYPKPLPARLSERNNSPHGSDPMEAEDLSWEARAKAAEARLREEQAKVREEQAKVREEQAKVQKEQARVQELKRREERMQVAYVEIPRSSPIEISWEERAKAAEAKVREEQAKVQALLISEQELIRREERMQVAYVEVPHLYTLPPKGIIYLLTHDALEEKGIYKVGCSRDMKKRASAYATHTIKPRIVGLLHCNAYNLTSIERFIHEILHRFSVPESMGFGTELFKVPGETVLDIFMHLECDLKEFNAMTNFTRDLLIKRIKNDEPISVPHRMQEIIPVDLDLSKYTRQQLHDMVIPSILDLEEKTTCFSERCDSKPHEELVDMEVVEVDGVPFKINIGKLKDQTLNVKWKNLKGPLEAAILHHISRTIPPDSKKIYDKIFYGDDDIRKTTISRILEVVHAADILVLRKYKLIVSYTGSRDIT